MRKEASKNAWKQLYDITLKLDKLEPWNYLGDTQLVTIQLKDREEPVFCSVMGKFSGERGIAVFDGVEGLGDFYMILGSEEGDLPAQYLMDEHTSLTCFWGSMMNVPDEQRKVIDELDIRFKTISDWIYFVSYNLVAGYANFDYVLQSIAFLFIILIPTVDTFEKEPEIDLDEVLKEMEQTNKEIEQAEGIVRRYNTENDTWEMFVKEIPEAEKEFPSVMLEDQELKDELKNQKQIDLEVILDFTYLPVMVEGEEEGERPKNPLLFMAYDNTDGGVITMDILEEGDDEISRTLGFFISFVQQNGRMKTIKARNPWIFGALEDICEYCSVDLVYDPVEIMDQVIEEVVSQL